MLLEQKICKEKNVNLLIKTPTNTWQRVITTKLFIEAVYW